MALKVGGKLDCFSCDAVSEARHGFWGKVSWLNARHMQFAWITLGTLFVTDAYIMAVAAGWITDLRIFN